MNISKFRLNLSAVADFTPAKPGHIKPQQIGWENLSLDFPASTLAHLIRISATNLGTAGETITIDASTLVVTVGTGAVATVTGGDGKDADGFTIAAAHWFFVGFRVVSGDAGTAVILDSDDFQLRAESGGPPTCAGIVTAGLIDGAGTWTIRGSSGARDPATVIEILVVGVTD